MVACFKWQLIVCVVFLAQALAASAPQEPRPQDSKPQEPLRSIAEMKRRGLTASVDLGAELKMSVKKTSNGYVDQPATFEVAIHNIGTETTLADASLLIKFTNGLGTEDYGLRFGAVSPNEKRTVSFEYKPLLPSLHVEVCEGIWDDNSTGWTQARTSARFYIPYDPKIPLHDLLPARRQPAQQLTQLPANLSDVPEVSFADPLAKGSKAPEGQFHVASALEKIKYVNQKKTDAYMELLLSRRADLAGLPFLRGDACRTKGESRQQFAATTKMIRDIQRRRAFDVRAHFADFSDSGQMTEVVNILAEKRTIPSAIQVAALWQMITPESAGNRLELVKHLHRNVSDAEGTRALAKLAIYSEEEQIRSTAFLALMTRRDQDYTDILVSALSYPWPDVAERASATIAKLGRTDLAPRLQEVLKKPDPRLPQTRLVDGKKKTFVRELVRINHLRNCMLCHAPAPVGEPTPVERAGETNRLASRRRTSSSSLVERAGEIQQAESTGEVPIPGSAITRYYGESNRDLLVRFDVTYLRQDFSAPLAVADADQWPSMQRYDFVVRTREINEAEAATWRKLLPADAASPYHRAARMALASLSRTERSAPE
ncbi:MAG: HEAT repeat domain-containing protein [Planctomycetes bacterium]|nr:HEAT repeat domain-containing protein [Planctomycetota bacterium]